LQRGLKVLLVMYCCQTSMLLLAMGISENIEWQRKEKGAKKQARLHLDWSELWGAYVCSRNSCRTAEIVRAHAWCRVCALHIIYSGWCGRRWKVLICVTIVRNWLLHLGSSTQLLVLLFE
jgi:hypothetical protein